MLRWPGWPAALRAFLSHASVVTGHGQRGALAFCAAAFAHGWRSRASRSPPRGVGVARMAQWCRALSSLVPASKASGTSNSSNLSKPSSPSSPLHGLSRPGCGFLQCLAPWSPRVRLGSSPSTPGCWGDPPFDYSFASVSSCGAGSSVDSISSPVLVWAHRR